MDPFRAKLHTALKSFVDNVYFQPPHNQAIEYPCIVYQRYNAAVKYADDKPYDIRTRYIVTVIDEDPDSDIHLKVASLPMSVYNRFFKTENLNHDVYTVFV